MLRAAAPLAALVLALALTTGVAHAHECAYVSPTTATLASPFATYYVVQSSTVWVYEESNGIPGLQAGCEACPAYCAPDTVFF